MLNLLTNDIETNSLGKWSALANSNNISNAKTECWGAVSRDGLVAFFKSVVLLDEVEIITTDNNCVLHFGGNNDTPIKIS